MFANEEILISYLNKCIWRTLWKMKHGYDRMLFELDVYIELIRKYLQNNRAYDMTLCDTVICLIVCQFLVVIPIFSELRLIQKSQIDNPVNYIQEKE